MRRLLVKRFESSFGAFSKSIDRFLQVHILVRDFIEKSNGKYILDRGLIDKIKSYDEDDIDRILSEYSKDLLNKSSKNNTVYDINDFKEELNFLNILKVIFAFQEIQSQLKKLKIVENDPKRERIANEIQSILEKDKNRKVILFSEYVDTIKHLEPYFREKFGMRLLVCDGKVSKELAKSLNSDFNAQRKDGQTTISTYY